MSANLAPWAMAAQNVEGLKLEGFQGEAAVQEMLKAVQIV
jgi:hypothetical protein